MIAKRPLADLLKEGNRNGLTKPKKIRGNGVKMVGMGEIFSHSRISNIDMERVPVTEKELKNYSLQPNDLLFARQSLVWEGAGKCSIVVDIDEPTVFESHLIRVRIDESIANPRFVYYFFNSTLGHKYVLTIVEQVAAAGLRSSDLVKLEIPCPDIVVQNKCASLLETLDKKIDTNTAINKNLEEQAQALYDELFADSSFDATLADLGTVVGGSTPSKKHPEYYTDQGIAWITPKDLSNDSSKFIYHGENDITELGLSKCSATVMPTGTVLFSSRAPIGYIAIAANPTATNQGFKSVIPNEDIGTAFIYYFLKNNLTIIESMASGSTFKEISAGAMKTVPAFIPSNDKLCQFQDFCEPLFNHQKSLESENTSLSQLRDTLLPRLMSGEIDVSSIEI